MKLVRPQHHQERTPPRPTERRGSSRRANWLTEWCENHPDFVLLECGHKEDLTLRGTLVRPLHDKRKLSVLCVPCNDFRSVVKRIDALEYHGIERKKVSNEPPF